MIQILASNWFRCSQNFKCRPGSALMMRCSRQRVQQQRQQLSVTGRRHDFLQEVRVAFEKLEAMLPRSFDFVKIAGDFTWRRQSFGQRPFERIVPEVSCNAAKRLLDRCRAAQNLLTT